MAAPRHQTSLPEIRNRKAFHEYSIGERFEAGLVLAGSEVKSLRAGRGDIKEAYGRVERGEVFLYNLFIDEYRFDTSRTHLPRRPRKLLLHRREIRRIERAVQADGKTLVPLRLYFKKALVKVEVGLATGKQNYDKRESLREKAQMREVERDLKYSR